MSQVDRVDPAYRLNKGPLLALASAVWDSWLPVSVVRGGLEDAWRRLSDHGPPWQSIRGPSS
eukprot:6409610-Pyramimonas_sp.AAC.1